MRFELTNNDFADRALRPLGYPDINIFMNHLYLALNIPNEILRESFTVHSFPTKRRHLLVPAIHLNFSILSLLNNLDLNILQAELFYSEPNFFSDIHTDYANNTKDISKINWLIHGENSLLNWYDTSANQHLRSISSATDGNVYKGYNLSECTLIDSTDLCRPSLIQAGVPHNSVTRDEPRWSVSLTLFDRLTKQHAKFSDVASRFSQYIIE